MIDQVYFSLPEDLDRFIHLVRVSKDDEWYVEESNITELSATNLLRLLEEIENKLPLL